MSTVNYVIKQLGNLIAPLGKGALASLVVVLALNEFGKYSYAKKHKTQRGGNIFNELVKTVLPMSKNDLLALASILLLNYFNQQKHHKGHRGKKKGGSTIYGEVVNLLAPVGVNAFGASVIILFLNDIFRKRNRHKGGMHHEEEHMMGGMMEDEEHMMGGMMEDEEHMMGGMHQEQDQMMGGTFVQNIGQLVAPLGPNAFFSVGILTILSQLFDRKSFGLKSGVKHSVSDLRKKLKSTISGLTKLKKKVVIKKKKATAKKKKAVVSKKKKSRK